MRSTTASVQPAPVVFLEDNFRNLARTKRFNALITLALGALGIVVATAAVYGTTKFFVASREHDTAIRLALGAPRARLLLTTVAGASFPVVVGAAAGLAGAFMASRSLESFVFGVATTDSRIYVGSWFLVVLVSAVSSLGPAVGAGRVDPLECLRRSH